MNIAHDYDPKFAFRNYNSNAPILQSWVEDLIGLTEKSLPANQIPTTETLVQALQRYDVIFKELLRQNSIFSDHLTKMFAQIWTGVLNLMTFMIKSYHRYVKHTSHLQSQAQLLLTERQRGEAAKKVQKEEFELERTALRAGIRNMEAEISSATLARKIMEHENDKLRKIISTYIQSADFGNTVWDIMKDDDNAGQPAEASQQQRGRKGQNPDDSPSKQENLGFRRRDIVDSGKNNLKVLNRLDVELNEILANVLKEKNRQRLLMKDLMRLVNKNKDMFTAPVEDDGAATGDKSKPKSRRASMQFQTMQKTMQKGAITEGISVAVQADRKEEFGLTFEREEDIQTVDIMQLGVAPLAPNNVTKLGTDVPYLLRRCMGSFPKVLRVPPAVWTYQMILAIYFDKMQDDDEKIQRGKPRITMCEFISQYFLKTMGLPSAADTQVALLLKACEAHSRKQPRITLFASQIGLLDKEERPPMDLRDTDFVLHVLRHLVDQGELQSDALKAVKNKVSANSAVYIRPDISRAAAISTVQAIFDKWLPDGGEDYLIKVRSMQHSELGQRYVDVDMFIETLIEPWNTVRTNWEEHARFLFRSNSTVYRILQEATFANDEGRLASDSILVEVQRQSALDCGRRPMRLFQKTDQSNENPEEGPAKSTGAPGQGNPNKESVTEAMNRSKFIEVVRIINPVLPMKEIEDMFEEALDMAHADVLRALELLWARYIDEAANYYIPPTFAASSSASVTSNNTQVLMQEAQSMMMARSAAHKNMGTNREFWVNNSTSISQWSRPYWPRIFRTQDIEIDTFVQILIRKDVFAKSPFLELLNIAPRDLWPNADMFYKQIKERQRKALMEQQTVNTSISPSRSHGALMSDSNIHSPPKSVKYAATTKQQRG